MSIVTHTFSGAAQASPLLLLRKGQTATYSVSGTYSGTVVLQRSEDGTNWSSVASVVSTTVAATVINGAAKDATYRWTCTAYTSGSPVVTIADAADNVSTFGSGDSGDALQVNDDGIVTKKIYCTYSPTTSASDIALTMIDTIVTPPAANESNSAIASLLVIQLDAAAGSPSYFVSTGGEIQVPAVTTNHLANATLYGGKFIVNFDTAATSGNCINYLVGLESELILKASNTSGIVTYPNVYNLLVANEPFTQTGGGDVSISEYRGIYVEALSLGARFFVTNHWNMYIEDTLGGSYFGAPIMVIGAAAPAAGGVTHRGVGGIRTEPASTQDALKIVGRAGGTSSFTNTVTTAALTASVTSTLTPLSIGTNVTQVTSRTTGVTINAAVGTITLVSAAGSSTWNSFTVTNSSVAATDVIVVNVKTGTDIYLAFVSAVAAGSFRLTVADLTGTTVEAPVLSFAVMKSTVA